MIAVESDGVEIDVCLSCAGVWLDEGELEWIVDQAGGSIARLAAAIAEPVQRAVSRRRCPRCRRRLATVADADSHVELERCRGGCGLWFDHGELERFVASARPGEERAVAECLEKMFGLKGGE